MKLGKTTAALFLGLCLSLTGIAQADRPVRIGHADWTDSVIMAEITKYILEEKMDREAELIQASVALLYESTARDDIDFHMIAWFPETHRDYMAKVRENVVDLGAIYTDAKLGWVIPDYIPKDQVSSIADLADEDVFEKLNGRIVGIDPAAGVTRLSEAAMDAYGLTDMGYELLTSSDAAMTASIARAVGRDEWVVTTGWSPHWMFGRWDLRYLDDPKGILGQAERSHIVARKGYYQEEIEVASMLIRMWLPIDELEAVMFAAEETSDQEAAREWVESNEKRVNYWVTGEM